MVEIDGCGSNNDRGGRITGGVGARGGDINNSGGAGDNVVVVSVVPATMTMIGENKNKKFFSYIGKINCIF